jgi:Meiotically up-regulated gene 113
MIRGQRKQANGSIFMNNTVKETVCIEIKTEKDLYRSISEACRLKSLRVPVVVKMCLFLHEMLDFAIQIKKEGLSTKWEAENPHEVKMFAFYGDTIERLLKQKKIVLMDVDFEKGEDIIPLPLGFVYVIKAISQNAVKIGFSKDPTKRLADLSTASPSPLELVAAIPGTMSDEKALHDRFADYRKNGEWLELDGAVLQWVRSL